MNQNARKILIFALFALSLLPVGLLVPYYQGIYSALKQYHVHGLVFCWLGSYVLANFCTPGFMQGVENKKEYESRGPLEIVTLYLSVMVITFVVLGVIIFCALVRWLVNILFGSFLRLAEGSYIGAAVDPFLFIKTGDPPRNESMETLYCLSFISCDRVWSRAISVEITQPKPGHCSSQQVKTMQH